MTDKSVHDATEEWARSNITKEFDPIDINDVYKAFAAGVQWQSQQVQVPEEATPEMEQAAEQYWNERRFKGLTNDPRTWAGVFRAMVAAAKRSEEREK